MKPPSSTVYTLAEEDVVLPCKFQPSVAEVIVQVIWIHVKSDGTEEQIITAHHQDGQLGTKHLLHPFVGFNCSCLEKKKY